MPSLAKASISKEQQNVEKKLIIMTVNPSMNAQELNDGKSEFLSYPVILINKLLSFVEVGTYILFFVDFKMCYGRIVKVSTQNDSV